MESLAPGEAAVCAVVREELMVGALRSQRGEGRTQEMRAFLSAFSSLPFDDAAADAAARIRVDLGAQGQPIGPHDVQIAAIAMTAGLVLVTNNTREYQRVKGLRIEDWAR